MFITFEGLDSSGKSTQIKLLYETLLKDGHKVIMTKEIYSEEIRNMVINSNISDYSKLLLVYVDRINHVQTLIQPKLKEGYIVLCDRYIDSTVAYQHFGFNIPLSLINAIHSHIEILTPDLTIFLKINPEHSRNRLIYKEKDVIESLPLSFFESVSKGYEILAKNNPRRIKEIDGTKSIENVQSLVFRIFNQSHSFYSGNRLEDKDGLIPPLVSGREEKSTNLCNFSPEYYRNR